ncbi:hypothetical protein B5X24_HaOG207882 [Helicoverpa armigera]|uniref:FLYWCH-type domain-containing protein n=1 Tax=Helicoverpa armigera TaxID=29058 RepID=A0A2W1BL57_HELAM|nr:hypothetical protein B5X24_HaOG207882 [Helicoverpa armigera]
MLLMVNGFTFWQSMSVQFIVTDKGRTLLMVNGFTFWQHNKCKNNYYCSRKSYHGCKSSVTMNSEGDIVCLREEHNHSPPAYKQDKTGITNFKFIQTIRGKTLLMVNGYTYTENNRAKNTFYCSRKYKSCKSSVKFDDQGRITGFRLDHNHSPPIYRSTQNGLYVKCSTDQNPSMYAAFGGFRQPEKGRPFFIILNDTFETQQQNAADAQKLHILPEEYI